MISFRELLNNPFANVIVSAVVGALASLSVAFMTLGPTQDRQMRLERVTEFSATTDDLLLLGASVVTAMNSGADLTAKRVEISDMVTAQILAVEGLLDVFGADVSAEARRYQASLSHFSEETSSLDGPAEIRPWVLAYDGVVNSQKAFKGKLLSQLGINV